MESNQGGAPLRQHGSRLEPGELEEIAITAGRGEPPTADQVLGLIETVQALARRCAARFQETQELRARLAEIEATPAPADMAVWAEREKLLTIANLVNEQRVTDYVEAAGEPWSSSGQVATELADVVRAIRSVISQGPETE